MHRTRFSTAHITRHIAHSTPLTQRTCTSHSHSTLPHAPCTPRALPHARTHSLTHARTPSRTHALPHALPRARTHERTPPKPLSAVSLVHGALSAPHARLDVQQLQQQTERVARLECSALSTACVLLCVVRGACLCRPFCASGFLCAHTVLCQ